LGFKAQDGVGSSRISKLPILASSPPKIRPCPRLRSTYIGIDFWEHAYYLQYFNGKAQYAQAIWPVINWKEAESRFVGGREDVFKKLRLKL